MADQHAARALAALRAAGPDTVRARDWDAVERKLAAFARAHAARALAGQRRRGRCSRRTAATSPARTPRTRAPPPSTSRQPPEGGARVAVIVPARDEVKHIEACVEHALAQDHAELKVFILDDGSTDGTGEVLARLQAAHPERLRVLTGGDAPLPEGWMGKPWACQRAGEAALADPFAPEWMLFTDADVRRELGLGVGGHHRAVAAEGAVVGRRAVQLERRARRLWALEGRRARRRQRDEDEGEPHAACVIRSTFVRARGRSGLVGRP